MKNHKMNMQVGLLLVASLLLSACGSSSKKVVNHRFTTDISGLELRKDDGPVMVYVRPGTKPFSDYDSFMIDPIILDYKDFTVRKLTTEERRKLQNYFHNSMIKELSENGFRVVTQFEVNTLRMSFVLSNIKAPSSAANSIGVLIPIALSVGEVTVEATFKDAAQKKIVAVAISSSEGATGFNSSPWSTWSDIESAFDQWAVGIREAISQ